MLLHVVSTTPSAASTLTNVKPMSWRFITVATVLLFAYVLGLDLALTYADWPFGAVYNATGHLVTPTLVGAGTMAILVVVGFVVFGRMSIRDFGWKWEYLVPGLAAALVLWIVMQILEVVANFAINGDFQLSPSWAHAGAATVIGVLIGQLFGTALAEETYFRGFLLPQLRMRFTRTSGAVAVGLAVAASQAVFAIYRLPNLALGVGGRVGTGLSDIAIQLVLDFAIGVVFAAIYIRTANIFLVMGIHALQNAGTSIVATPIDPATVIFAVSIIALMVTFAPALVRRVADRGSDHPRFMQVA